MTKQQTHLRRNFIIQNIKLHGFLYHPGDVVKYKRKRYVVKAYGNNVKEYYLKDYQTGEVIQNVSEIMLRNL